MPTSSSVKFLIGTLAIAGLVISAAWTVQFLQLPEVYAFEENEGGGDQGNQSEAPAESPTPASEEQSHNGGRSGHETVRLQTIARFVLKHLYSDLLDATRERPALSLDATEQAFLCSMSRIRQYNSTVTPLWFPEFLAELINRPAAMVQSAMWSEACER